MQMVKEAAPNLPQPPKIFNLELFFTMVLKAYEIPDQKKGVGEQPQKKTVTVQFYCDTDPIGIAVSSSVESNTFIRSWIFIQYSHPIG